MATAGKKLNSGLDWPLWWKLTKQAAERYEVWFLMDPDLPAPPTEKPYRPVDFSYKTLKGYPQPTAGPGGTLIPPPASEVATFEKMMRTKERELKTAIQAFTKEFHASLGPRALAEAA